ncbi:hypothetical protein DUNSADRAFT_12706 [Dunaliella salina]|uniref:Glutaredoxin-like protein n=1 Tax=Dunaliella salina TaxID=3046 RepID=A0ABQ7GAS7_DUNSA|nr:hypothetical protein DUNSADRAFT_12706 [Dunaliella salina]|eukprot:KAF5831711.1 hypothetical protein DUNSADRAFT_12706 [Dunaliella salina]
MLSHKTSTQLALTCQQRSRPVAPWSKYTCAKPSPNRFTVSSSSSSSQQQGQCTFILYTKKECPLCDGLHSKVEGLLARAAFMPSRLSGCKLEVRDIATNPEWQSKYAMSVPVLAVSRGGEEVQIPRPMPRISPDRLQRLLEEALPSE